MFSGRTFVFDTLSHGVILHVGPALAACQFYSSLVCRSRLTEYSR